MLRAINILVILFVFFCSCGIQEKSNMVKPISEKEFAKLAADDKGKIFIEKFMSGEILVYKMSNGQIIFNHRGKCGMCNNKKDFEISPPVLKDPAYL